jgi:hypothetical protein
MRIRLDLIESRLQALIEEWIIPVNRANFQSRLAHQLIEVMQRDLDAAGESHISRVNRYTIFVHPTVIQGLENKEKLLSALSDGMQTAAREAGFHFIISPVVSLEVDPSLPSGDFTIANDGEHTPTGATAVLHTPQNNGASEGKNIRAYLMVNGTDFFPIHDLLVVNLGRRPDNDLVLNDPRVSRTHAQIRFNRGNYVLFDLNSTGGTLVNGQRIQQCVLKPGDVISLAGFPLIYGEESGAHGSSDQDNPDRTQAMRASPE